MERLKILLAVLQLYRSNFQNLHWNAAGNEFDKMHNDITGSYKDLCDQNVDIVAEMLTRLGVNPANYKETLDIITSSDKDYLLIDSTVLYEKLDIVKFADIMLQDILKEIEMTLSTPEIKDNISNVGIKAELEGIHNTFDLQYRYLNRRRSTKGSYQDTVGAKEN